ncbi:SapC family protein [Nisaea nitritireducens]|uniref:SapC family protein n=1 Tax=Nisaea nitritireducens TaxID=568392 RepID=UPI001868E907|nr:SapC family protein [Nisaea nitritireducens]
MSLIALTRTAHENKGWARYSSYEFAAQQTLAVLVSSELPKAIMHLPVAFTRVEDQFRPAAVLSFEENRNLFVTKEGKWIGGYIPAAFRAYPFALANTENDEKILCFDESSGLLVDGAEGEAFFDSEGNPSASIKQVLDFLQQVEADRQRTDTMCASLEKHDLIEPWPINLKTETGENKVEGLFRINENRLNELPDEAFLDVRRSGALSMAYMQLISMTHLPLIGKLYEAHAVNEAKLKNLGNEIFQMPQSDELNFNF